MRKVVVTYKIVDSISKIDRDEWNYLFGNIPEGYEFYPTLEKSDLKEFSFCCLPHFETAILFTLYLYLFLIFI
jgi:hypothetical protein